MVENCIYNIRTFNLKLYQKIGILLAIAWPETSRKGSNCLIKKSPHHCQKLKLAQCFQETFYVAR